MINNKSDQNYYQIELLNISHMFTMKTLDYRMSIATPVPPGPKLENRTQPSTWRTTSH